MASKQAFLVLGVLLVVLLAVSSEVAAKEQEKTQTAGESVDTVDKDGYGHGHGGYGHGHGGYGHGHGGHGHGHGCKYGCCGGYAGSCKRCCSYAGEVPDAETEAEPQN